MDMKDIQIPLLPSNSPMSDPNEEYTFQNPYPQQFSIPYPIIKYMIQNPTGKAWKKLIQTCKYFYSKNSIFPVQCLTAKRDGKFDADGEIFDAALILPSKLWLYGELYATHYTYSENSAIQVLTPKIFKSDIHRLELNSQCLTWEQYQIITSAGTLKRLIISEYFNESKVTFDKLIENLHQLKILKMNFYGSSMFAPDTTKKVIEIFKSMKNLHFLFLRDLPETFDFTLYKDFIMKNEKIQICLYYSNPSETQQEMLHKFVDEIIQNPPAKIPYIEFRDFYGSKKYAKYEKIRKSRN